MGATYSIIAQINKDGSVRYIRNDNYSDFHTEAVNVIRLEERDFQAFFVESKSVKSLYELLSLSVDGPEVIFLYTDRWQVLLEGVIHNLEDRLQHDEHWFSNLISAKYSVIGLVQDSGEINYIHFMPQLEYNDVLKEILELREADIEPFLQQGDLQPTEGSIYEASRIGHPKTVSSLYHLLAKLPQTPILYGKKLQWIFLYHKGKWGVITDHSLIPGKLALEI